MRTNKSFALHTRIDCVPLGKGRPRVVARGKFAHAYTPEKTRVYEKMIADHLTQCMGGQEPTESRLRVTVDFYMPVPKALSKKAKEALLCVGTMPNHIKKPDIDNLVKSVMDALNGVVWVDDCQVTILHTSKGYSEQPGIVLQVEEF